MKIVSLTREMYEGFPLKFEYTSTHYYDVIWDKSAIFKIELVKKAFEAPVQKRFDGVLYSDYIENAQVFGVEYHGKIIAYLEVGEELWHNRLRISELLVDEAYRGNGLGSKLLDHAKCIAKEKGFREIVLETQSCNEAAIATYLKNDFRVMGIDLSHYSNDDINNREVRLEMMYTV